MSHAKPLAVVSYFGEPDGEHLRALSKTYWTVKYQGDIGLFMIDVKMIQSVVMMAPDEGYPGGLEVNYWYFMEKPGLTLIGMAEGNLSNTDGDDDE